MFVCCECCVLSGRGLCDELITRPEESYRLWCVVVCDLETSWMKRPWPNGGLSRQKTNILTILWRVCVCVGGGVSQVCPKRSKFVATEPYDYITRIKTNSFLTLNFLTAVNTSKLFVLDLTPRTLAKTCQQAFRRLLLLHSSTLKIKKSGSSRMVTFQLDSKVSHPRQQQQHTIQASPSTITHYATGPDAHRLHRTLLNYLSITAWPAPLPSVNCADWRPHVTSTALDDKKQSWAGSEAELSNR
jgi:hypothetical protein